MKNDKKIYDVTVQVVTDIPFQVLASSEEDAREQIVDEVHSVNYKHFLRESAHEFIYNSQLDDSDFWQIRVSDEDASYRFHEYQSND
tara:strand:+ start:181 stop:441 length:261 start_codon:yes stop_codon:yes gene_type:complete